MRRRPLALLYVNRTYQCPTEDFTFSVFDEKEPGSDKCHPMAMVGPLTSIWYLEYQAMKVLGSKAKSIESMTRREPRNKTEFLRFLAKFTISL